MSWGSYAWSSFQGCATTLATLAERGAAAMPIAKPPAAVAAVMMKWQHGFDPVALVEPAQTQRGLLVQRAGRSSQIVPPERIAALARITQRVGLSSAQGEQQNEWTGPLLWDVIAASSVVDLGRPREMAHLAVRITGADGYSALITLGEIAPQFEGKQVLLADQMNGVPMLGRALRLLVPGDGLGGRSVRDVVRIDVG
jgi:hypothetical protein